MKELEGRCKVEICEEDFRCCDIEIVSSILPSYTTVRLVHLIVGFMLVPLLIWKSGFSRFVLAYWVMSDMIDILPIFV